MEMEKAVSLVTDIQRVEGMTVLEGMEVNKYKEEDMESLESIEFKIIVEEVMVEIVNNRGPETYIMSILGGALCHPSNGVVQIMLLDIKSSVK